MISVIMPAYNASTYIREAIESLLNQTFTDFELIIVDDKSTDNTLEIIQEYAAKDSRIRILQPETKGLHPAVNAAMDAATYNWIARCDADDVYMPNKLQRLWEASQADPDVIVWGSYAYQINPEGEVIGYMEHGPVNREEFNLIKREGRLVLILNPTCMYRRDIALELGGYDTNFTAAGDEELWSRMIYHGPMQVLPEHLIKYRIHGGSITSNRARYQMMVHKFIEARHAAKTQGKTLSFEAFENMRKQRPIHVRLPEYIGESGRLFYRRAGNNLIRKRYPQAILLMGMALVCNPRFTVSRISGRLQRRLRSASS